MVGLSKLHAAEVGTYDYTGSPRFAWSVAFIGVLAVAAYGTGLPDVPRTRRTAVLTALAAAASAAVGMSIIQLLVGDALLPRFVVFGAGLLLVPWYLLVVNLAADGRTLDERRDRVVVVAEPSGARRLQHDLDVTAESAALVVASVEPARDGGRRPGASARGPRAGRRGHGPGHRPGGPGPPVARLPGGDAAR